MNLQHIEGSSTIEVHCGEMFVGYLDTTDDLWLAWVPGQDMTLTAPSQDTVLQLLVEYLRSTAGLDVEP